MMGTWKDLVTASLIGTERAVVPAVGIPGLFATEDDAGDPAAVLLDRAALLTAARRAGRPPDRAEPLPVCEPDSRPAVGPAAGRRLARLLSREHPDLLTEWLTAVATRDLRIPPQLLPALLDGVRGGWPAQLGLPRLVADAGGPRATWLAGLNPEWAFAAIPTWAQDDAWRLGDVGQRRDYLASLLVTDPDAARELVTDGWAAAGPRDRVMFLSVLADGLGPADEPLLDAALGDRAEDVRRWAAYLLARLPGSALGRRMAERALRYVRIEDGPGGHRLAVTPPAECDASMRHDGIVPGPARGRGRPSDQTRLLLEVVARTPLRTWTDRFGLTAAQVVSVRSGQWAPVLFAGWSQAAIAQRDRDWMAPLLRRAITGLQLRTPAELEALRLLARRADPALGAPGALPRPELNAPPGVKGALSVLRFRYDMLKELDDDYDRVRA
jgi:hypothetical protein